MTGDKGPDPVFVAARRVLLDAFDALDTHRKAVVLVGAQAIYLHVGDGDLAVAPFTTDGDLAIDPRHLDDEPALANVLEAAGFELAQRPGTWTMSKVQIDLMVPGSLGGSGRRGARLGAHGNDVARKTPGLEAAVVDHVLVRVAALDPTDTRAFDINVASLAALLVAKLHKIYERRDDPARRQDKDALDVLRLLRFADTGYLAARLVTLAAHPISRDVTLRARGYMDRLFSDRNSVGSQMAVRACVGLDDEVAIAVSCELLAGRVLEAWIP